MPSGIYKICKSGWGAAGCAGTAGLIGLKTFLFNDMGHEIFDLDITLSMKAMPSINFQVNNTVIVTSSFYFLQILCSYKTWSKIPTPKSRWKRNPLI